MTKLWSTKGIAYAPLVLITNQTEEVEENKKCKWPSIVITFWIISIVMMVWVYLNGFIRLKSFIPFSNTLARFDKHPYKLSHLNGYLINTPGCRIPYMDPYDASVIDFIYNPNKINCIKKSLFKSNLTSLLVATNSLHFYGVSRINRLKCCYREFWRRKPVGREADNKVAYSRNCISISSNVVHIGNEFIKVTCKNEMNQRVYEDYFAFVPIKKAMERRTLHNTKPNILVLGLDAISRTNLHRHLLKTYEYMVTKLGAIELLGYNKVGDNTFPNLIPVLTGLYQSELKNSCWPTTSSRFDECSFLWHNFSKNGYLTVLGEDCGWLGLFNYLRRGFSEQSTDYYYTSFNREMETKLGYYENGNCIQCAAGKPIYQRTLDYIQKVAVRMNIESIPYFGFFWSSTLTHDYVNQPALGDEDLYKLIINLKEYGILENTIFVLISDHGIRQGELRNTYQGQMEERLPFVLVALPKWFKANHPTAVKNFEKNTRVLTTPFDLHDTLNDLSDLKNLGSARKITNCSPRSYSLFTEIPSNRTCDDATIDSHWCTCLQTTKVRTNDTEVVAAADFVINHINSLLKGFAQCSKLVLNDVLNARLLNYDSNHITSLRAFKHYTIIVRTIPGDGLFEATVRLKDNQDKKPNNRTRHGLANPRTMFSTTGTISRLNLYGHQSYCITDFNLKLYCYCKDLLQK